MSHNIKSNIEELFTGDSDIEIKSESPISYYFSVDDRKYNVQLMENEIFFNSFKEDGTKTMIPVKNNKNQFIVLNTVIKCIEKIFKNIPKNLKREPIFFTGDNTNGLAKVYMLIANKLKGKLPNYTFSSENSGNSTYFIFSKNKTTFDKFKSKKDSINELFKDDSDIYSLEHIGYNWYEFTDGLYKYRVRKTNEIFFSYYNEHNDMWMTKPTKNNKNQFKVLNTVIYCFKQIINNTNGTIKFSGQISNGLAKLYITLFNRLKNFIISNGFVGFYTDSNFEIFFFLIKKEKFDYSYWERRIYPESLIGYTPETDMKKNIKESTSISITNSDGSAFSITCDDANELNQIMKNAGLSNYFVPKDDLGDLPIISDDEMDYCQVGDEEVVDDIIDVEEIPSYEYDVSEYDFGIDADDYDISYEDPYGNLADEVGYVIDDELAEVAELNSSVPYEEDAEESLFNMKGTAHQSDMRYVPGMMSDNPMVDELRESTGNEIPLTIGVGLDEWSFGNLVRQLQNQVIKYNGKFKTTYKNGNWRYMTFVFDDYDSIFNFMEYFPTRYDKKFSVQVNGIRVDPSDPEYIYKAEEQTKINEDSNEFDDELNDAMTYCREDIDESDMLDALGLNQAGPIDSRYKQILISKLAEYLYTRYVNDITDGNTRLTPNNFEGFASVIFEENLWHLLQDEGFYWTSNND